MIPSRPPRRALRRAGEARGLESRTLKLQLATTGNLNTITAYGEGFIAVNGERHAGSLVVLPERVLPWAAASFDEMTVDHVAEIAALAPEVVLLGTGTRQRFPHPSLLRPLTSARIGIEVMDTHAACRTYSILVSEGRKVAAALFVA